MPPERSILFVCTGNTCRSPMAEAIARELLARRPIDEPPILVASAGATALDGEPVSAEARIAVESLGMPFANRSASSLNRRSIREADAIYAMTRSHARSVLSLEPEAGAKVHLLDPDGGDIPDPIGGPQRVYTETARRLLEILERRIKEHEL